MDAGEEYQLKIISKMVEGGQLKAENRDRFIDRWRASGKHVTSVILEENKNSGAFFNETDLLKWLSKLTGFIEFDPKYIRKELIPKQCFLLPAKFQKENKVFFYSKEGPTKIGLAMVNPYDNKSIGEVGCFAGCKVVPYVTHEPGVQLAYDQYFTPDLLAKESDCKKKMLDYDMDDHLRVCEDICNEMWNPQNMEQTLKGLIEKSEIQLLVQIIFHRAMARGTSDFHFEPFKGGFRLRCRSEGVLKVMWSFSIKLGTAINARLRAMSEESPLPSVAPVDARIAYNIVSGKNLEFRVSILPVIGGEKIVMRAIDSTAEPVSLDIMGFTENSLKKFRRAIWAPQGMCLITGPTGSGKTTTLYSVVHERNEPEISITTAEDPVEAQIAGVAQVQCKVTGGTTFFQALKAFLRQDPNIILIGEIRDKETAEMAMKAGMTGHMVISTLHTNDAPSTINRLLNMDVAPFLIAAGVNVVHAQRLVRKVCKNCKKDYKYTPEDFKKLNVEAEEFEGMNFFKGEGCEKCEKSGLKGRLGLFEVLDINDAVKQVILARGTTFDIAEAARKTGFMTLREDGLLKARNGDTSLDEVIRATM